jgi:hypothetical protein
MVTAKDTITPEMKIGNNDPAPRAARNGNGNGSGTNGEANGSKQASGDEAGGPGGSNAGSGSESHESGSTGAGVTKTLSNQSSGIFGTKSIDPSDLWQDFDAYAKHPNEHPLLPKGEV